MREEKKRQEELWDRLRDLLNEMDEADCSVHFGSQQDASTEWWNIPYASSGRTCTIEVMWNRHKKCWERGAVRG
ncbi:hypothetical protein ACWDUX_30370 [Streptomyces sp. NPDC003444]